MRIFVDCDSCPSPVREIVVKASDRTGCISFFVANHKIPHSTNAFTHDIIVEEGKDKADDYIVQHATEHDIAVTRDMICKLGYHPGSSSLGACINPFKDNIYYKQHGVQ